MYIGKHMVYIGFGTTCGLGIHLGLGNVSPVEKGGFCTQKGSAWDAGGICSARGREGGGQGGRASW